MTQLYFDKYSNNEKRLMYVSSDVDKKDYICLVNLFNSEEFKVM